MNNPMFTAKPETIAEIAARTGHDRETIIRCAAKAFAAKLVVMQHVHSMKEIQIKAKA